MPKKLFCDLLKTYSLYLRALIIFDMKNEHAKASAFGHFLYFSTNWTVLHPLIINNLPQGIITGTLLNKVLALRILIVLVY